MHKLIFGIVNFCLFFIADNLGDIPQTKLLNAEKYATDVLKMLMLDLEDEGFCSLLMNDLNLKINETIFGQNILGDLRYFNGFVIGADGVSPTSDLVLESLSEKTFEASVSIMFVFKGLSYAYDMEAELMDGIHRATGIFKTEEVIYKIQMNKNLKTKVCTSSCDGVSIMGKGRIDFQPKNYYTTIIARKFNGDSEDILENFREFGAGLLGDLLQKIVTEKINFPAVNFDTKAT